MRYTKLDNVMRMWRRIAVSAILAIGAMLVTTSPAHAIVNGSPDEDDMFPNVGAIVATEVAQEFQDLGVQAPQAISSGTLIHPRVMLTAGHSVAYMNDLIDTYPELTSDDFVVSFEPDVSGEGGDGAVDFPIPIADAAIHPDFTIPKNDISLDVGVVILAEPAPEDIPLMPLPKIGLLDTLVENGELTVSGDADGDEGTPLVIVGYGATEESQGTEAPFTEFLIVPSGVRHFGIAEFQSLTSHNLHISRNFAQGESGGAAGDSGGPAYWVDPETAEFVQVALVSWGDGVGAELGVPARIDLPEVQDWLEDVIWDVEKEY